MSIRRYKYFAIKKLRKNLKLKTIRRFDFLRRHYEGKKIIQYECSTNTRKTIRTFLL